MLPSSPCDHLFVVIGVSARGSCHFFTAQCAGTRSGELLECILAVADTGIVV